MGHDRPCVHLHPWICWWWVANMKSNFCLNEMRDVCRKCFACKYMYCIGQTNLRHVDAALLEGAIIGIVGTHVSIFAPVAWKGAIHTGETPIKKRQWEKKSIIQLLMATYRCIVYQTMTFSNYCTHSHISLVTSLTCSQSTFATT